MISLNTNIVSTKAYNALNLHRAHSAESLSELASGKKTLKHTLNSADYIRSANAANSIQSLGSVIRGVNDAISLVRSMDVAAEAIQNKLLHMQQLANTVTDTQQRGWLGDQGKICLAMRQAQDSIVDIANAFQWNGQNFLLGGGQNNSTTTTQNFSVRIGSASADTIQLTFKSFDPRSTVDTGGNINGPNLADLNATAGTDTHAYGDAALYYGGGATVNRGRYLHVDDPTMAANALLQIGRAIDGITTERSRLSAYVSRLEEISDSTLSETTNTRKFRSQLLDAEYAAQSAALSKQQILQEVATAVLAQSNQMHLGMLELLK